MTDVTVSETQYVVTIEEAATSVTVETNPTVVTTSNFIIPASSITSTDISDFTTAVQTVGDARYLRTSARYRVYLKDDFITGMFSNASGTGETMWASPTILVGNAGAGIADSEVNHPGIIRLFSGTSASSYGINKNATTHLVGGNEIYEAQVKIVTLSTGAETWSAIIGLADSNTAPVDGIYFTYTDDGSGTGNNGKWVANCASNSVVTSTASSGAAVSTGWHTLRFEVNSGATSVAFYVDDVLIATITTNIPTGAGRETGLRCAVTSIDNFGSSTTLYSVDYVELGILIPAGR